MKLINYAAVIGILFTPVLVNAEVPGAYNISSESPMGIMKSVLVINEDGTGSLDGMMGKIEFTEANIDGSRFDFSVTTQSPMGDMDMTYSGIVEGDEISGEIENLMGGNSFSGKRK